LFTIENCAAGYALAKAAGIFALGSFHCYRKIRATACTDDRLLRI
jgi:hypothetical protein